MGALLHLAAPVEPPGITTLYLPVEDGEPFDEQTLRRGVDFVLAQRVTGKAVLIACGAGISRSTSFAIAALGAANGAQVTRGGTSNEWAWTADDRPPRRRGGRSSRSWHKRRAGCLVLRPGYFDRLFGARPTTNG